MPIFRAIYGFIFECLQIFVCFIFRKQNPSPPLQFLFSMTLRNYFTCTSPALPYRFMCICCHIIHIRLITIGYQHQASEAYCVLTMLMAGKNDCKNEVGCRDDSVTKTVDTRKPCEVELRACKTIFHNPLPTSQFLLVAEDCCMLSILPRRPFLYQQFLARTSYLMIFTHL